MMPSFSLAALTALELAPIELIDVAAACGYDHVGLRLLPAMPGGVAYPLMEDDAALRETIARLAATGVTVADLEVVPSGRKRKSRRSWRSSRPVRASAPGMFWSRHTTPTWSDLRIALPGFARRPRPMD